MEAAGRSNRLAGEKSPYLLQHARNPVDWYPWGEEAFAAARRDDKPVFVSIGYSTCHWCHVMERESFADVATARLLNDAFVCVKVDREERPDLDQQLMAVCQAMTGSGGWPLTILMTPDRRPFFAGTYFPKERRRGRPGLAELVPRISEAWRTRRGDILRAASEIAAALSSSPAPSGMSAGQDLGRDVLDAAFEALAADFDAPRGGFGRAPKFPIPHQVGFLLRYGRRTGESRALDMAERTLLAMRRGGIFDQLGFGFHRYATDADWRVPHFEKMLYDQALLTEVYIEAYLAAGRDEFLRTALEIGDYVLGELASPEGAFYTAEDADSEGEEGCFYLWREDEILAALGKDEGERVARHFGVRPGGNFEEPGRGPDGRNVLHIGGADGSLWPDEGPAGEPRRRGAAVLRETLLRVRRLRPAPFKDTKILADGNGLMIGAMARLSRVSDDDRFGRAALRATDFLLERLRAPDGRLFHVFADGRAFVPGFLDDYAFLAGGLIDLYESMFQPRHLAAAVACVRTALDLFWDEDEGGCFFSAEKPEIGVRRKEVYDGAVPSGNSVMLMNLLRLAEITGDRDFEERARLQMRAFAASVGAHPRGSLEFLRAVDFGLGASRIVVVGDRDALDARRLFEVLRRTYLPRAVIVHRPPAQATPDIAALAPPVRDMTPVSGKAAVYICERGRCLPPVTTPEELLDLLRKGPVATP